MMIYYRSGGINASPIGIICTQIYTRITISSMTVYSILPHNIINQCNLWDLASFASLTRMLVETCHRYFYLADVDASSDKSQRDFRLMLYYYHLNCEKYKLLKAVNSADESLKEFRDNLQISKRELIGHAEYSKLDANRAYKVRSGNVDMHFTDAEMVAYIDVVGRRYGAIYRILSAHAHGTPLATISQSNERGRGIESESERIYYIGLLTIIMKYLSKLVLRKTTMLKLQNCNIEEEFAEKSCSTM